jgi:hypothetical protein
MSRWSTIALLLATAHCAPATWSARAVTTDSGWVTVAPPGTGFSCMMPGVPLTETAVQDLGAGPMRALRGTLTAPGGRAAMLFGIVDVPQDLLGSASPRELMETIGDGMLSAAGEGELVSSDVTYDQGFAALIADYRTNAGSVVRLRILRGMTKVYFAVAMFPTAEAAAWGPIATNFLGSIRLDPADGLRRQNADGLIAAGPGAWRWIIPDDLDFAFEMPGDPVRAEGEVFVGALRGHGHSYRVQGRTEPVSYTFRAVSHEGPGGPVLEALRADMRGAGFSLRADRASVGASMAAHDLVFDSRADGRVTLVRVLSVHGGWLEMTVTFPRGRENDLTRAHRFFHSLRSL